MKTETKWIILGILTSECKTGYDIKNLIDASFSHFWKMSYGQIYPALKTLVEDGYATQSVVKADGTPERKEYTITTAGKKKLEEWLTAPVNETVVMRNELLVKLFFGLEMQREQALEHLDKQGQMLSEKLEVYHTIEKNIQTHNDSEFWLYTLNYGKEIAQAELRWCQKTKESIQCKSE
ncbi:PadR family transcriptional regulator [Geomicrobium sediminis]|uniref:DNA-binding PadR family transcriptional regulator n=1 Tax=Geomicrobium sediminis TaxID=1347788 RepID=A0ABS2PGE2_9BACL|nr:PadR family transcriptional regulator [Geomicrobium sediminis]MBM7634507.1 DNA-binding PadR family transcriptional regulator [Geomicrobium sediminis]